MLRLSPVPWLLVAVTSTFSTACGERPTAHECLRLLDHYVALLTRDEWPEADPADVERKQREARKLAESDPRFEFHRCPDKVSRRQLECALAAPNVNGVEQCLLF